MTPAPWEITPEMFLTESETLRLLAGVRAAADVASSGARPAAELDRLIVEVLLFSGLRCSEFCRLRVADTGIALGEPVLRVRGRGGDARTVWLPRDVDALIRRFVREWRRHFVRDSARRGATSRGAEEATSANEPLALNERGRAFDRTALYRRVVRVLTQAGLAERASVQLLRHTYGYLAYLRTRGNLLFVQRQLGHAHPVITALYAVHVPESYAELADQVSLPVGEGRRQSGRRRKGKSTQERAVR